MNTAHAVDHKFVKIIRFRKSGSPIGGPENLSARTNARTITAGVPDGDDF
jgi:hypothetical protein